MHLARTLALALAFVGTAALGQSTIVTSPNYVFVSYPPIYSVGPLSGYGCWSGFGYAGSGSFFSNQYYGYTPGILYAYPPGAQQFKRTTEGLVYDAGERADEDDAPPTSYEVGRVALREGDFDVAAPALYAAAMEQESLEQHPAEGSEPAPISREPHALLALAYVGTERYLEAHDVLTRCFAEDASFSLRELDSAEIFGTEAPFKRLIQRSVAHAHRAESGEAWRLVANLMRLDGRRDLAAKMDQRAEEADDAPERPARPPRRERQAGDASFRVRG
ncbi:MAG: hypothetical protein AAGD00_02955 [Planctomycetota bacterium]